MYVSKLEQKAKEIGKLKDILDRKEQQLKQMKETDKVLIEGDYATIMGVKYKRVEEPKPETLFDIVRHGLEYSIGMCDEIVDSVRCWLPNEMEHDEDLNGYRAGWNDCINTLNKQLR